MLIPARESSAAWQGGADMQRESFGDASELLPLIPTTAQFPRQCWGCFTSPESLLRYLEAKPKTQFWYDGAFDDCDIGFRGTKTWSEAVKLCRDGWQDGVTRVARIRDRINAARPKAQRLARWSVAGAYPSVARHLAGNPDCMRSVEHTAARTRPIITILAHIGGLAMVEACTFVNKAGVTCAVVDAIEAAGYSCHVVAWQQSHDRDKAFLQGSAVTLKLPGEAMDIARMAFALGHPSYFRRMIFALKGSDRRNAVLGRNLGFTCEAAGELAPNIFMLPSLNTNADSFASEELAVTKGLETIIEALKNQGCPAFEA
jgi:hypothetical protein